jgi:hypothetical protein
MRMNVKLFTLQMSLFKAEELRRNPVAKRNGECCTPVFSEDINQGPKYLSSNKAAARRVEPQNNHSKYSNIDGESRMRHPSQKCKCV